MSTKRTKVMTGHDFGWALQQMRAGKAVALSDTAPTDRARHFTLQRGKSCFCINDYVIGTDDMSTAELLSKKWITVERIKCVSFPIALAALKKGKKIARKGEDAIVLDVETIKYMESGSTYNFHSCDLLAEDWYIL